MNPWTQFEIAVLKLLGDTFEYLGDKVYAAAQNLWSAADKMYETRLDVVDEASAE